MLSTQPNKGYMKCQTHAALGNNVIWIGFAETRGLEQVHDVGLARTLLVQAVFVLLQADRPSQDDLVFAGRKSVVRIVKHDLHFFGNRISFWGNDRSQPVTKLTIRGECRGDGYTFVEEGLAFFARHRRICVGQHESNS